jgi:subtilisin family serine protease
MRSVSAARILVIAAGGNGSNNDNHYPAAYQLENIISVSALDQHGELSSRSNETKLAAPGVNILTTALGNEFEVRSGSSMAAAVVSGVAALTLAAHPESSLDQLKTQLLASLDEKRAGSVSRGKRLNAARALRP